MTTCLVRIYNNATLIDITSLNCWVPAWHCMWAGAPGALRMHIEPTYAAPATRLTFY